MTQRLTLRHLLASLLLAVCGISTALAVDSAARAPATAAVTSAPPAAAASAPIPAASIATSSPAASSANPSASVSATSASASTTAENATGKAASATAENATSQPGRVDALAGLSATASREGSAVGHLMQVMGALLFIIMLMLALAWFLKNHGPKSLLGRVPVKVVGGVNLGGRERVLVIDVADQWLVIGATPSQISTLATLPRQSTPEDEATPGKPFSLWLKQIMEKRNG